MDELNLLKEVSLRDPLSQETRTERRTLLAASAIGIVIVKSGLVPSKISALGIEFNQTDQKSLLLAIAAVVSYFLIAFLVYAGTDFLTRRIALRAAVRSVIEDSRKRNELSDQPEYRFRRDIDEIMEKHYRKEYLTRAGSSLMPIVRSLFEFALPIVIAVYSIILLVRARL